MSNINEGDFFKGNWMTKKRAMGIWDLSHKIQDLIYDTKAWKSKVKFKKDQDALNVAVNHLNEAKKKIDMIGHRINNLKSTKK